MKISIAAKTDIGKERDQNEDVFIICPDLSHPQWERDKDYLELGSYGALLAVADGMGGGNAGEVAASIAKETVRRKFSDTAILKQTISSQQYIIQFLQSTIEEADNDIRQYGACHPEASGLGTTIVLCWLLNGKIYVAWCGDSRCYIFNHRKGLQQITKDHSFVQGLVDNGDLTKDEAFTHPDSNIITRALGDVGEKAIPDITMFSVETGETILLCSDGLCGYCTNKAIEKVMKAHSSDTLVCCQALIDLSLNSGGFDNICIALAKLESSKKNVQNQLSLKIIHFLHRLFKS